jgi:hypothetical protein
VRKAKHATQAMLWEAAPVEVKAELLDLKRKKKKPVKRLQQRRVVTRSQGPQKPEEFILLQDKVLPKEERI